jgi:aminopeptidase N
MKHQSTLYIVLSFLYFLRVEAQTDSLYCALRDPDGRYREHNVDFIHLQLDVAFSPKEGQVTGKAIYQFQPIQPIVDSLFLNAPGIKIKKVTMQDKQLPVIISEEGVTIKFPKKLNWKERYTINIDYIAKPQKGLYFIGWNVDKTGLAYDENHIRTQIWTQGQGIDNRHWIPCYDDVNDRLITELRITFDSSYTVVSNGRLKSCKVLSNGMKRWHYAMPKPHVPYLIMLAIDKYKWKDIRSNNGITSRQYYYPERPETFDATYKYSQEMMDWFPTETGVEYPWQTYANVPVQEFMYGAMENTTATIFTDYYVMNDRQALDRNYIATNAHELAHQWFGDYVTEWSATHHWLHESFATYYSKLFMRHTFGEEEYDWIRRTEAFAAIQADQKDSYPVAHSKGGSARHYPKGSFVLGMLREVTGDEVFKKTIKHYLRKHALGNVDTHDFWRAFMETAGINLDWFFEQWVYHSGIPNIEVACQERENNYQFIINQTNTQHLQQAGVKMPVWLEVHHSDGKVSKKQTWLSGGIDTVEVSAISSDSMIYWLFDPGYHILKTMQCKKTVTQWLNQAKRAENVNDRWDAVRALEDSQFLDKINHLITLSQLEKNHNVLEGILGQLAKDSSDASINIFINALNSNNLNKRKAAISQIRYIPEKLISAVQKVLKDSSYQIQELALKKLFYHNPEKKSNFMAETEKSLGTNKNVRIAWLEIGAKGEDSTSVYWNELRKFCSPLFEFRTRLKAMEAATNVGVFDPWWAEQIIDAACSTNSRLSRPAKTILTKISSNPDYLSWIKNSLTKLNLPEDIKQVLNKIKNGK